MAGLDDLAALGEGLADLNERAAELAAPLILAALRKTAAASQAPDGTPWPPSSDGGPVLTGAAGAISISADGVTVTATIGVPYVFHDRGAGDKSETKEAKRASATRARNRAKGGFASKFHAPRRQILPDSNEAPETVVRALAIAADEALKRTR